MSRRAMQRHYGRGASRSRTRLSQKSPRRALKGYMGSESPADHLRRSMDEPDAFAGFYDAHFEGLLAYLTRRTCDAEAALDLTAESFAQAFLSRQRFAERRMPRRPPGFTASPSASSPVTSRRARQSKRRASGSGSNGLSSVERPSGRSSNWLSSTTFEPRCAWS